MDHRHAAEFAKVLLEAGKLLLADGKGSQAWLSACLQCLQPAPCALHVFMRFIGVKRDRGKEELRGTECCGVRSAADAWPGPFVRGTEVVPRVFKELLRCSRHQRSVFSRHVSRKH